MISSSISNQYNESLYTPDTSYTTGTILGANENEAGGTDITSQSLGKDDFLKLLLAELKYQDPLNPADNTEFVAQLAQFSTLEQMEQMNTNLESTMENNTKMTEAVTNASLVNYFGKAVEVESSEFIYDGESEETTLHFELADDASSAKMNILNSDGDIIRTMDLGVLEAGAHDAVWDGMKSSGVLAAEGVYSYEIVAKDTSGEEVEVTPLTSGVVQGISKTDDGTYLNIGGIYVLFDKVRQVVEYEE